MPTPLRDDDGARRLRGRPRRREPRGAADQGSRATREHPASLGALGPLEQASVLSIYDPDRARARRHPRRASRRRGSAFADGHRGSAAAGQADARAARADEQPAPRRPRCSACARAATSSSTSTRRVSRATAWAGARLAFGRVVRAARTTSRGPTSSSRSTRTSSPRAARRRRGRARGPRGGACDGPGDAMSRLYVVEPRADGDRDERRRAPARCRRAQVRGDRRRVSLAELRSLTNAAGRAARGSQRRPAARRAGPEPSRAISARTPARAWSSPATGSRPRCTRSPTRSNDAPRQRRPHGHVRRRRPSSRRARRSHGLDALVRAIDAGEVATLVVVGGDPGLHGARPTSTSRAASAPSGRRRTSASTRTRPRAPARWFVPGGALPRGVGRRARLRRHARRSCSRSCGRWSTVKTAGQVLAATRRPAGRARRASSSRRTGVARAGGRTPTRSGAGRWCTASSRRGIARRGRRRPSTGPPIAARARRSPPPPAGRARARLLRRRQGARRPLRQQRLAAGARAIRSPSSPGTTRRSSRPATAARLGVADEDVVELARARPHACARRCSSCPGRPTTSSPSPSATGRRSPSRVSRGVGANAYAAARLARALVRRRRRSARTGDTLAARAHPGALARWRAAPSSSRATLDEYRARSRLRAARTTSAGPIALRARRPTRPHQWGMTIDLNACTGCSACVVACQAENNIPVVGKGGVRLGREMHWLRIDTLLQRRPASDPGAVVPADALPALREGALRVRLPGQRHGAQPRRAQRDDLQPLRRHAVLLEQLPLQGPALQLVRLHRRRARAASQLAMNPDVTVRARGVMEKCTYCVQRIREAEIRARRRAAAASRDGEIVTACQQACPTRRDRRSATSPTRRRAVARARASDRALRGARTSSARGRARATSRASPTRTRSSAMSAADAAVELLATSPPAASRSCSRRHDLALTDELLAPAVAALAAGPYALGVTGLGAARALRGAHVHGHRPASASGATTSRSPGRSRSSTSSGGSGSATRARSSRAILLLLEQTWRTSINRFAEAMTLFAVMQAGLFPLLHLGRPVVRLLAHPVPARRWASGRSSGASLPWDVVGGDRRTSPSRSSSGTSGLIPDLAAAARPRADAPAAASSTASSRSAGAARRAHWRHYRIALRLCSAGSRRRSCSRCTRSSASTSRSRQLPGLALDDLPAVLRRRRHLLGLRDGAAR